MADAVISRSCDHAAVLADYGRARWHALVRAGAVLAAVFVSAWYVNLLDFAALANGVPAIWTLARESFPPDFSNAPDWWKPLVDTLAMSIAGTAVAVVMSFPMAFLAARNTSPHPIVFQCARIVLNALR